MIKQVAILLLFFISEICFADELIQTKWKPQWHFDQMDESVSCSLFSNQILFRGKFTPNNMYIGVQNNGSITFQSKKNSFDSRYIKDIGIRVGSNSPIYEPEYVSSSLLKFSEEKSRKLREQLTKSSKFTVQVYFFPDNRREQISLSLGEGFTSFQNGLTSQIFCEQNKNGKGWVGIAFTDMPNTESYISVVKKYTEYDNPGAIIWSVHPKKMGASSGLENFDIVLGVDEKPANTNLLLKALTGMSSGESIKLHIMRGNNTRVIELTKP